MSCPPLYTEAPLSPRPTVTKARIWMVVRDPDHRYNRPHIGSIHISHSPSCCPGIHCIQDYDLNQSQPGVAHAQAKNVSGKFVTQCPAHFLDQPLKQAISMPALDYQVTAASGVLAHPVPHAYSHTHARARTRTPKSSKPTVHSTNRDQLILQHAYLGAGLSRPMNRIGSMRSC